MGPPGQLFFPSCLLSSEDSRRIHTVKYKSSSLLIKKNLFRTLLSFFHKIKRTYQTHIFLSFNNEICYLNYDTKHFFFFLQTPKTRFSTILFKPQFSHLFKQQFLNFMTKRSLALAPYILNTIFSTFSQLNQFSKQNFFSSFSFQR